MSIIQLVQKVNKDTGEVLDRSEKELPDYFQPEKGYRLMARTKALRVFPNIPFPKELKHVDLGRLMVLTRATWANTGCLGIIKNREFRPFDDKGLYSCVGFTNDRKGRDWIKRMKGLSMIRSVDVNMPDGTQERQWYVNPVYFCPMFLSRQSYLIWRDQVEEYLPEYIRKLFN